MKEKLPDNFFMPSDNVTDEQTERVSQVILNMTDEERAQISFLALTMQEAYQGMPTIGISSSKPTTYMFVSTCGCDFCQEFEKQREDRPAESFLTAAMIYASDRLGYMRLTAEDPDCPKVVH